MKELSFRRLQLMPRAPKRSGSESKSKKSNKTSESANPVKRSKIIPKSAAKENMPSKSSNKPKNSPRTKKDIPESSGCRVSPRLHIPKNAPEDEDLYTSDDGLNIPVDEFDDDYSSESSMLDEYDEDLDGLDAMGVFPFRLQFTSADMETTGRAYIEGLSSSEPKTVLETLEKLNDYVNMSLDDVSFSIPVPRILPLLFKHMSMTSSFSSDRIPTISAQVISVILDSSAIASKMVASTPDYLDILRQWIDSPSSNNNKDMAEQCITITSRMVKEYAREISQSKIAEAILRSFNLFSSYTQKQSMELLEQIMGNDSNVSLNHFVPLFTHSDSTISQRASSCWTKSLRLCSDDKQVDFKLLTDLIVSTSTDPIIVKNILEGLLLVANGSNGSKSSCLSIMTSLVESGQFPIPHSNFEIFSKYINLMNCLIYKCGSSVTFISTICQPLFDYILANYRELQNDSVCLFLLQVLEKNDSKPLDENTKQIFSRIIGRMLECPHSYQLETLLRGLQLVNNLDMMSFLVKEMIYFKKSLVGLPKKIRDVFEKELLSLKSSEGFDEYIDYSTWDENRLIERFEILIEQKIWLAGRMEKFPQNLFEHPIMIQFDTNRSIVDPRLSIASLLELIQESEDMEGDFEVIVNGGIQIDAKNSKIMTILEAVLLSYHDDERSGVSNEWRIDDEWRQVRFVSSDDKLEESNGVEKFIWSKKPHKISLVKAINKAETRSDNYPQCSLKLEGTVPNTIVSSSSRNGGELELIAHNLRKKFLSSIAHPSSFISPRLDRLVLSCYSDPNTFLNNTEWIDQIIALVPFVLSMEAKAAITYRRFNPFSKQGMSIRQKIKLDRNRVLAAGMAVFDMFGASAPFAGRTVLEMEFVGEVGSGSGPTNEFYSLCCEQLKETRRSNLFKTCSDKSLFPKIELISRQEAIDFVERKRVTQHNQAPTDDTLTIDAEEDRMSLDYWWFMGLLVGRGIADHRLVDLNFSWVFWYCVHAICMGQQIEVDERWIQAVDPGLWTSLQSLRNLSDDELRGLEIPANVMPGNEEYRLEDLTGIVSGENVDQYCSAVVSASLLNGVVSQIYVFAQGLCSVIGRDIMGMWANPHELTDLVAGRQSWSSCWSRESLMGAIRAQHGYSMTSPQIHDFVDVVVNLDPIDRERFVKFITGSNRLPHGGFGALDPPLTVVKATRDDGDADSFLPSVMTCANFLKLPEYSNREIMKQQILKAIREGQGSFLLS